MAGFGMAKYHKRVQGDRLAAQEDHQTGRRVYTAIVVRSSRS